ncbi:hypothetical protein LAZ67_10000045 [Cordylochernes scorpioides]|uniref:Uncharacterized protein n=1 Tax=Cordylochernes scorpioides TaxID=51811 RepID=A0ABY6KVE8_9ARAC|nr:hypothetical protein LAZ67_10000045 [Cordylochernes scorpioides]
MRHRSTTTRQKPNRLSGSRWFCANESEVDHICQKVHGQCVKGILLIDNLKKGRTITDGALTCLTFLTSWMSKFARPGLRIKKSSFTRTTHLLTKSVLAMGKLRYLSYDFLGHPPYSPDLPPSDSIFSHS